MRYRLAFNRMASALRLAGSIYVSQQNLRPYTVRTKQIGGKVVAYDHFAHQLGEPGNRKQPVVRFRAHFAQQQSRRP